MSGIVLTAYSGAILGPIAKFLGWIMNFIYNAIYKVTGIESVVLSIIIITIIIYMCMLPLTIRQQKFSKLSQTMQPEIKAVQDKYQGKRDQASMTAMQEETQLIYEKYGVSPMGSCLPLIIQMPILFALYRVFYNVPAYLTGVKESFTPLADGIIKTANYQGTLADIMEKFNFTTSSGITASNLAEQFGNAGADGINNYVIDILYKLPSNAWDALSKYFPDLSATINQTHDHVNNFNYLFGLNISDTPLSIITTNWSAGLYGFVVLALLIPILSYATQLINIKLMPQAPSGNNDNDQMARSMKTMNFMMPFISFIFCFSVPVGLGIYWIFSAIVRGVQQFFINKHIAGLDLDDVIKENQERAKKKRAKKGIAENQIRNTASMSTKNLQSRASVNTSAANEKAVEAASNAKANAKAGSLASKANLVKEFNESSSRK